jgi:hypothetical protein
VFHCDKNSELLVEHSVQPRASNFEYLDWVARSTASIPTLDDWICLLGGWEWLWERTIKQSEVEEDWKKSQFVGDEEKQTGIKEQSEDRCAAIKLCDEEGWLAERNNKQRKQKRIRWL